MAIEARDSVGFVDATRQRAKSDLGLAWFAIALYSAFAVAVVALGVGASQGIFLWIVSAPVVAVVAFLWAFVDGRQRGVEASRLTLIAIPFGLLTMAFALGALGWYVRLPLLAQFGPPILMAVGYIVIGTSRRKPLIVLVGVVALVVAAALALLKGGDAFSLAILAFAYVTALLVARAGQLLARTKRT